MKDITVIKIGGSTLGSRDTTIEDIISLQKKGNLLVVVHGGGNTVTDWLKRHGVKTEFVRGERVTDLSTLEVATAVLAGLVNKEIVASINSRGGQAVGISGVDGTLIESKMKNPEMGYVGEVVRVNIALLETLLGAGFIPVVSSISLYSVDRPNSASHLININADPVAGYLAEALTAKRLVFLTDVAGITDASGAVVSRLSADEAEALITSGVISGGMIPKIRACLRALSVNAVTRIIDGRRPHILIKELEGQDGGTTIYRE